MSTGWPFIDADNELVADLIAGTVEIVLEQGGWLNPQACIVARDGQLSITADADDGAALVHLPRAAFVRIARAEWSASVEQLELLDGSDDLTVAESELLILQTALHNSCGKIPALMATHPVMAADLPEDVIAAVRAFRPSFRLRQPTAASLFWSNRSFRLPVGDEDATEPVALPIVDLLNHGHGGATGTWTGEAFDVTVRRGRSSTECLLDYGLQRDAIGMAVVYGFADVTSTIAHSAPLSIEVSGFGRVRVEAIGRTPNGDLLAPRVAQGPNGLTVSHLSFGADAPNATGIPPAVLAAIAEHNVHLVDELISCAGAHPEVPSAGTLAAAATRRRQVITDHQR